MAVAKSLLLALLLSTATFAVPVTALAHCPPHKAKTHKAKPHKVKAVKKVKTVSCNCTVAAKPKPKPRPRPAPTPPAPPPVDHPPYASGGYHGDHGPSRVVNLNVEGWETATYTSRVVDHRIITVVHDPRFCRDRLHRH